MPGSPRAVIRALRQAPAAAFLCVAAAVAGAQEPPSQAPPPSTEPEGWGSQLTEQELLEEEALFERRHKVTTAARHPQDIRRSSAAVTVITARQIRLSGARTLVDLLRSVAGVSVIRSGISQVDVNIRGLNTSANPALMLLINGQPAQVEFFGITPWDHLPVVPEQIERIEIIRGPASPLYGANAFSGVIDIITRAPAERSGGASVSAGTRWAHRAAAWGSVASERWGLSGMVSYSRLPGYSNRIPSAFLGAVDPIALDRRHDSHTDENLRASLDGRWRPATGVELALEGRWTRVGDLSVLTSSTTFDVKDGDTFWGRMGATWDSPEYGTLRLRTWSRRDRYPVRTIFPVPGLFPLAETIVNDTFDVELQHKLTPFKHGTLTFGGGWHVSWLNGRGLFGSARRLTNASFFFQLEQRLLKTLDVTLSLRWDLHTTADTNVSPRGALVWTPHEKHALRLSAGQAFRNPTHAQSFAAVTVPPGLTITGNPDLESEQRSTVQLDYETTILPPLLFQASAYYSSVTDLIVFSSVPVGGVNYINAGSTELAGGEAEVQWRVASWLRLWGNYGLNWVNGRWHGLSPKHTGSAGFRAGLGKGFTLSSAVNAVGKAVFVGLAPVPEREVDPYLIWQGRLGWQLGPAELAVSWFLTDAHEEFPRGDLVASHVMLELRYAF